MRSYFYIVLPLVFALLLGACKASPNRNKNLISDNPSQPLFAHGVASGDPSSSSVVLWSRITIDKEEDVEKIRWEIAKDSSFTSVVQSGNLNTGIQSDFTIKKLVNGLQADTYYYYRFWYGSQKSITGRTKTLPKNETDIRLIAVSCNSYEGGYFTAYSKIAERKEKIDAVVHLGDYIYEAFLPKYIKKPDRIPFPKKELHSLQDYRNRYAQYHLDENLKKAHRLHPFINIWDDHEIANDAYAEGASAHSAEDSISYVERRENAKKAFYEWLPIEDNKKHFRSFQFGTLGELFMLDGRLEGRTIQKAPSDTSFKDGNRHLLGQDQLNWLKKGIESSSATWKVIGNPVLFADFDFSVVTGDRSDKAVDNWSGYPAERKSLIDVLSGKPIDNLMFLSGDSHCSWAFEIMDVETTLPVAIEIGVPSVSSDNWDSSFPPNTIQTWERELRQNSSGDVAKYVNLSDHGYVEIELSKAEATFTWFFVDKDELNAKEIQGPKFSIEHGKKTFKN